jgi:hypothetical protein
MPLLATRLAVAAAIVGASFAVGIGDELKTRAEAIAAVKTKGDVIVVLCTTPQVSDTLPISETARHRRRNSSVDSEHSPPTPTTHHSARQKHCTDCELVVLAT